MHLCICFYLGNSNASQHNLIEGYLRMAVQTIVQDYTMLLICVIALAGVRDVCMHTAVCVQTYARLIAKVCVCVCVCVWESSTVIYS